MQSLDVSAQHGLDADTLHEPVEIQYHAGLIAVGVDNGQAAIWTSPDGVNWSRVPHDETLFGTPLATDILAQAADHGARYGITAITAGPSGLVAIGADGPGAPLDAVIWNAAPE